MSNTQIVSRAVNYLRSLARRRTSGFVTADDVQRYLDNQNFPRNTNARLSVVRQVLNTSNFQATGFTPSRREEARRRNITAWTPAN
jgi:hypothetical protein